MLIRAPDLDKMKMFISSYYGDVKIDNEYKNSNPIISQIPSGLYGDNKNKIKKMRPILLVTNF
jgi:hypothetical protein